MVSQAIVNAVEVEASTTWLAANLIVAMLYYVMIRDGSI